MCFLPVIFLDIRNVAVSDWKYCVIQCTGYLKSWAPAKIGLEEQEGETDGEACNLSCLVAIGRLQTAISTVALSSSKPHLRPIQFVSRHAMDGKFLFVDQRYIWFIDLIVICIIIYCALLIVYYI